MTTNRETHSAERLAFCHRDNFMKGLGRSAPLLIAWIGLTLTLSPSAGAQIVNHCGVPVDGDGVPQDDEGFVSLVILGTGDIDDKQQGMFTDDFSAGGGGRDLHPFTEGQDIIADFDPVLDMIDVGDFARPGDGFETLTSLEAIEALSTEVIIDGQPALVIDVDGELGVSTTTMLGITIEDLNEDNVFFGLGGTSIPPQPVTWASAQCVTMESGCMFIIPGHEVPGSSGQAPANPPDPCAMTAPIFADHFESGDASAWSLPTP